MKHHFCIITWQWTLCPHEHHFMSPPSSLVIHAINIKLYLFLLPRITSLLISSPSTRFWVPTAPRAWLIHAATISFVLSFFTRRLHILARLLLYILSSEDTSLPPDCSITPLLPFHTKYTLKATYQFFYPTLLMSECTPTAHALCIHIVPFSLFLPRIVPLP